MLSAISVLPLVELAQINVQFPEGAMEHVQMVFRWVHFVAGFTWVGLLYFFNLVNVPTMKELEAPVKNKVVTTMLPRALWWFRWGAVVTVLAGLLYFLIFLMMDARNAGEPGLAWRWLGLWLLVWVLSYGIVYFLLQPAEGALNNGWLLAALIGFLMVATSWLVLSLLAHPEISARSLSIAVGGGLGLHMLLNVWGIIWRAQKKIIAWTAANLAEGTAMPRESAKLARRAFLASRTNFWLSFPMLFFMAAAQHYPFLSGRSPVIRTLSRWLGF